MVIIVNGVLSYYLVNLRTNVFSQGEKMEGKSEILRILRKVEMIERDLRRYLESEFNEGWTYGDIEFLKENHGKLSGIEIAKHLNKSLSAVYSRAWRLRLPDARVKNRFPPKKKDIPKDICPTCGKKVNILGICKNNKCPEYGIIVSSINEMPKKRLEEKKAMDELCKST